MPRKTKDTENVDVSKKKTVIEKIVDKLTPTKKKTTATKKTTKTKTDKKATTKKEEKKAVTKKTAVKKAANSKIKKTAKTTEKKTNTTKKTAVAKKAASTSAKKETKSSTKKATSTKASVKQPATTTAKKTTTKKVEKKPVTKKTAAEKKTTATKKAATKKAPVAKKSVATKAKATTKKTTAKKSTTTRTKKATPKAVVANNLEYYDLPYRYNQTIVKVLAQTPSNLFIYWDISDEDRENLKKQFGENFFETTKPILKIYNDTKHYDYEVEINDFANSWYLHIEDSKCDYRVELVRRPIYNPADIGGTDYVYISSSNEIETPNDKILFNVDEKMVYFRNVKTNKTFTKSFANLSFIKNMGKIYNIYDLYKKIYNDEDLDDLYNPSSKFF